MRVFARFCGVVCVVLRFVVNLLLPKTCGFTPLQQTYTLRQIGSYVVSVYADSGPLRPSLAIHARLQESRWCGILVASARLEQCNHPEVQLEV